ncbi:MAG: M15 family metallopeptidase, partial [Clostridia bacterium]|nr:M15 family metallopeptidase [Clostridia bacterium]
AIFEEIYNDPEQFPIHSIGGARFSDTLRHSWGCAIDINPVENYYIHYASGSQVGTCCWENVSQYPWIDSRYCITPNGSVVRAFAKYGWGWGGQGWSTAADYMHFSILASGG